MNAVRVLFLCLTGLAVVVGTSCFDGGDDDGGGDGGVVISGDWTGATSDGEPVVLNLSQTGGEVTGTARFGTLEGNLTGLLDGRRFEAAIQSEPVRILFASVAGASASADASAKAAMSGTLRDLTGEIVARFDALRQ